MGEIVLPEVRKKTVSNSSLLILLFALKARYFLFVLLQVLNAILLFKFDLCQSSSVCISSS